MFLLSMKKKSANFDGGSATLVEAVEASGEVDGRGRGGGGLQIKETDFKLMRLKPWGTLLACKMVVKFVGFSCLFILLRDVTSPTSFVLAGLYCRVQ